MTIFIILTLIMLIASIQFPLFMGVVSVVFILLLSIPTTNNLIHSKIGLGKKPAKTIQIIMILLLFVSSASFYFQTQYAQKRTIALQKTKKLAAQWAINHKAAQKAIKLAKKKKTDYFNSHRTKIIKDLRTNFYKKNYKQVVATSSKYMLLSNDRELKRLNLLAKEKLILQKLQTSWIPFYLESNPNEKLYRQLFQIYRQLVKIFPNNARYVSKQRHYHAAEIHAAKINKLLSPTGTYVIVYLEHLIRMGMYNPDSYKRVRAFWRDMGKFIVVRITFRGTNAFGGIITQTVIYNINYNGDVIRRVL